MKKILSIIMSIILICNGCSVYTAPSIDIDTSYDTTEENNIRFDSTVNYNNKLPEKTSTAKTFNDTYKNNNGLVGNLVAQTAASYFYASQTYNNGIKNEKNKLFCYSNTNIFSQMKNIGQQPVTDPNGRFKIDCSTFVGLVVRGLAYQDSPYYKTTQGKRQANVFWDPTNIFNDGYTALKSSQKWLFSLDNFQTEKGSDLNKQIAANCTDIGRGFNYKSLRTAADLAYYFAANGYIVYNGSKQSITASADTKYPNIKNGDKLTPLCNSLQPGDLIFWAKPGASETQKSRFYSISHVGVVAENTSRFYHVTALKGTESQGVNKDGGVYYSCLDDSHANNIVFIIRPAYIVNANGKIPTNVNLYSYPAHYSYSVNSQEQNNVKFTQTQNTITLDGTSQSAGTRYLRYTYNTDINSDSLFLVPGTYKLSIKLLSGTVNNGHHTQNDLSFVVKDKYGKTMAQTKTLASNKTTISIEFIISQTTQVNLILKYGNNCNFKSYTIEPKLEYISTDF